jgi:hypothetical protein
VAEAIFGLVGVIVGAVVTGGVEFVAERRREAALLRKAARLVEAELDEAATIFEGALEDGKLWSGSNRPEVPSWREYAPVLAEGLDTDDWGVVEAAAAITRMAARREPDQPLTPLGLGRHQVQDGYKVIKQAALILSRVAGDAD